MTGFSIEVRHPDTGAPKELIVGPPLPGDGLDLVVNAIRVALEKWGGDPTEVTLTVRPSRSTGAAARPPARRRPVHRPRIAGDRPEQP